MNRRNFLSGVFGGVAAAGAGVIVKASPREIERFASPLVKDEPIIVDAPRAAVLDATELLLYDKHGTPVMAIHNISFNRSLIDVTSLHGDYAVYRDMGRVTFDAHVLNPVSLINIVNNR